MQHLFINIGGVKRGTIAQKKRSIKNVKKHCSKELKR